MMINGVFNKPNISKVFREQANCKLWLGLTVGVFSEFSQIICVDFENTSEI